MEKRTCKLCFKTFSNGRALGGHMRSHMLKLQTHRLPPPPPPAPPAHLFHQLEYDTDSASYSYSSEEDDKGLSYGLRENPRKSFRLVDPEFASFAVDAGSVVQDRESETESSKNPSRRRSKRSRKTGLIELPTHLQNQDYGVNMTKKPNSSKPIRAELVIEHEPVSSVSDTTPDEDVAWCLMMLSRGIRSRKGKEVVEEEDYDDEEQEEEKLIEESEEEMKIRVKRSRGKFQCGTCNKFFRSYQALGGHRASHKKIKGCNSTARTNPEGDYELQQQQQEGNVVSPTPPPTADPRIHECPVCFRVFSSGQALGGHKRSHLTGSSSTQQPRITNINTNSTRFGNNLIDLNLPAPMEDEDQFELSAVSDGEFLHPNKFY